MKKRSLPLVSAGPDADAERPGLGLPTIMSPALASRYGEDYICLAVLSIDLDRVRLALEVEPTEDLPFAWEVFLTEVYLGSRLDTSTDEERESFEEMLEETCNIVFDQVAEGEKLGSQLLFAAYSLLHQGCLSARFKDVFGGWKSPPTEMLEALDEIRPQDDVLEQLIDAVLSVDLDPPLADLTEAVLTALQDASIEVSEWEEGGPDAPHAPNADETD